MLSPFPGMDPFLEEPSGWSSVHTRLINAISDYLAGLIAPNFYVEIEQRVYISLPDSLERWPVAPDVYVVKSPHPHTMTEVSAGAITAPSLIEPIYEPEIRDRYLEIRDTHSREVVTTIELLSPFNKTTGTAGREAFWRKRETVMASKTHWLEIDLLRAGERPAEVRGKSDYYALLKRGGTHKPYEVWYIDLRDSLPTIAVPLRPPYEDVPLNLQSVFNDMYTRAHYAESVDYTAAVPLPRLRPADSAWLQTRLQEWLIERGRIQ